MADFYTAYERVARAEGGYQKHPNDTGNYNSLGELVGTNWGINAKVYESWIGRAPSELEMRQMSLTTAQQIYRTNYWSKIQGDQIESQPLADIIFDGHVNHGNTGIKLLQRVLQIQEDGIFGPITLTAVNTSDAGRLYNGYKLERINFYHYLVNKKPSQYQIFLKGWLNRMAKFNDFPSSSIPRPINVPSSSSGMAPIAAFIFLAIIINQ